MKIVEVNEDHILFDNGSEITFNYIRECYEDNYADFNQIDTIARATNFNENLDFRECDFGFRFGNYPERMFFVPCYSVQNGYYSSEIDIYFNDQRVLSADGEIVN